MLRLLSAFIVVHALMSFSAQAQGNRAGFNPFGRPAAEEPAVETAVDQSDVYRPISASEAMSRLLDRVRDQHSERMRQWTLNNVVAGGRRAPRINHHPIPLHKDRRRVVMQFLPVNNFGQGFGPGFGVGTPVFFSDPGFGFRRSSFGFGSPFAFGGRTNVNVTFSPVIFVHNGQFGPSQPIFFTPPPPRTILRGKANPFDPFSRGAVVREGAIRQNQIMRQSILDSARRVGKPVGGR